MSESSETNTDGDFTGSKSGRPGYDTSGDLVSLVEQLRIGALRHPDELVLKHVDGREMSYTVLWDAATERARCLAGLGVRTGDRVATFLDDYFASFVNWMAIGMLAAVEVPVNPVLRTESLLHPLDDSTPVAVLTTSSLLPHLESLHDRLRDDLKVVVIDAEEPPSTAHRVIGLTALQRDSDPDAVVTIPQLWDPACIIYTSGTTGRPKGVIVPWGLISHNIRTSIMMVAGNPGPRYCYAAPFHMSGKYNLAAALRSRETLVVRDGFSLSQFWPEIREHGCTYAQLFPQLALLLLAQPASPEDRDTPLSRMICSPAFAEVDEFKERFGIDHVASGYGSTEIGGPITNMDVSAEDWHTCGTVVDNPSGIEVLLVDEHDNPVPEGEVGEIIVRTRAPWALNVGYLGLPEATVAAWRNGWFHTGDAGRIDENGKYLFVDRMKDCVRRMGENISSFELEAYIAANAAVKEVAVIGVPSPLGEEDIKAVILLNDGHAITPEELIADLQQRVPKFMIPRYVEFVTDFPRTAATGRIQKVHLKRDPITPATWDRETASEGRPR
jgi:crotonobetaine/carnitine-CoA ligase